MTTQVTTTSAAETERLAARLGARLRGGDVVTLDGPLGAGKTCFVRGLARGLNLDPEQVSSPTFIISQEYAGENAPTLVHIDAYRLHGAEDLESIGWEELLAAPEVVLAIEWPTRIESALHGLMRIDVTIEPVSQAHRVITINAHADHARLEGIHD